jgi:hypothetical protein
MAQQTFENGSGPSIVSFNNYSRRTSVVPDTLKIYENSSFSFQVYCVNVYPEMKTLIDFPVGDTFFEISEDQYSSLYESQTHTEIPISFPFVLKGIPSEPEKDVPVKYKQIKRYFDKCVDEGIIIPPERYYRNLLKFQIKEWNVVSTDVKINGMRVIVRIAPVYEIEYQRNVKYQTGFWKKTDHSALLKGTIRWAGVEISKQFFHKEKVK